MSFFLEIGRLKVELGWLRRNLEVGVAERRALVEPGNLELPRSRQCELLDLARLSYCYRRWNWLAMRWRSCACWTCST